MRSGAGRCTCTVDNLLGPDARDDLQVLAVWSCPDDPRTWLRVTFRAFEGRVGDWQNIAAVRIADDFGCDTIGIQYQQGLKDLTPASDLVEGMLNNVDRPPVRAAGSRRELFPGEAVPHFNEVDECAGFDGLLTNRVHRALGQPVENTLHDLRWGDRDRHR